MANFFKGILRVNFKGNFGDLESQMIKNKDHKMAVTIEKGKCIAWIVGEDDIELSTDSIKKIELVDSDVKVSDMFNGASRVATIVDIYKIEMSNGQVGKLRLIRSTKRRVLALIANSSNMDSIYTKTLDWFKSAEGLETFKQYTTQQSYALEEDYKKEFSEKRLDYTISTYLKAAHEDAKIPSLYLYALASSLKAPALELSYLLNGFIVYSKYMIQPYYISGQDEFIEREPVLPLEQVAFVEKNPMLNFVMNFNLFEFKDDAMGDAVDKVDIYMKVLSFIAANASEIEINKIQWLFNKDTYLDNSGKIYSMKEFLIKGKKLSGFAEYFDDQLAKLEN